MRKIFMASLILLLNLLLPISAFADDKEVDVGTVVTYEADGVSYIISDHSVARVINGNEKPALEFYRAGDVTITVKFKAFGEVFTQEDRYHVIDNRANRGFVSSENFDTNTGASTVSVQELANEVLRLVNEERAKVGARPLVLDKVLMDGCEIRARELTQNFSHTRPNGRAFRTALRTDNPYTGENIAAGQSTPEEVVDSWMHSPGHRANILNKRYSKLGVGYYYSDSGYRHYWVQIFMGKVR